MFHIALYQPEIPPNTGNIIRLCANASAQLHLIHPLGFEINDKRMRRAGLDYHEFASVKEYSDYQEFRDQYKASRIFAASSKVETVYSDIKYQENDIFLFGPESRGLPAELLSQFSEQQKIRIPTSTPTRSLNLANAASIILFEAWRQHNFK